MELIKTKAESALDSLRALAMVARAAAGGLQQPQRATLDAIQQMVLGTAEDLDRLDPVAPAGLARHLQDPIQTRQLIRLMVVVSLAAGPPTPEQVSEIGSFASALRVKEPAVAIIKPLSKGNLLRFRLAFARHAHIRIYMRNTYRITGAIHRVIRQILIFRGVLGEDAEVAARFHALAELPEGTLGHTFHRHCKEAGIPFNGEVGGFPVGALFHDFTHVLAGYDTSPEGEMKASAFQAGYLVDDDDFFTALFAIVIHTAGINMTPFEMPVLIGRIGQGSLALDVLRAMQRGAAMKVDLSDRWDFWKCVELPIDVVRDNLGIPPLEAGRLA